MIDPIIENNFINSLITSFPRSAHQINKVHETDAELLTLGNRSVLAITTDSIVEEIETGLYKDPYLTGWMIVTVNMSDLAAVGAKPIGILISEILPPLYKEDDIQKIQKGIADSCRSLNTFVLGGDINFGSHLILTGTALGICENSKFLTRIGCKPNQVLYSTNNLGKGNAFAAAHFLNIETSIDYFPSARIKESEIIKKYASACIDTSDGVIASLDQLMRLNKTGFELCEDWICSIDPESKAIAERNGIPLWLLLAGQLGEFELIFTIDPETEEKFIADAKLINWQPVKLGKAIKEPVIKICLYGKLQSLDSTSVRNLSFNPGQGIQDYLNSLLIIDAQMK